MHLILPEACALGTHGIQQANLVDLEYTHSASCKVP